MVENVERLRAKFGVARAKHLEVFEQRQIEIRSRRIIQGIPAAVSERQTTRGHKGCRVRKQRSNRPRNVGGNSYVGIPHAVGVGSGSKIIRHAAVVSYTDSTRTAHVD